MSRGAAAQLLFATDFAAKKHSAQRRKGGDQPYIEHPIGVARVLSDVGVDDVEVLCAALLHDTIEDTDTTWAELSEHFPSRVVEIVREVTDDKSLSKGQRKRNQVEHAKSASKGARLVKLSDKLYNVGSLFGAPPPWWDARRIQGYFVWAKKVTDVCLVQNKGDACFDKLGEMLAAQFARCFEYEGQQFPALPEEDLDEFLEEYFKAMDAVKETD